MKAPEQILKQLVITAQEGDGKTTISQAIQDIRSYYLSLLPEVKSCMCPKTDMECGHAQWDRGHNHCRGEMEKRIKG